MSSILCKSNMAESLMKNSKSNRIWIWRQLDIRIWRQFFLIAKPYTLHKLVELRKIGDIRPIY